MLQIQAQPQVAAVIAQAPNNMNAVPPPRTYGRGRLPEGICWYCRQPGHRKPDCQLWRKHRSELEEITPQEQLGQQTNINMVSITPIEDSSEIEGYAVTRSQGAVTVPYHPKAKKVVTWEDHDAVRRETVKWLQEEQCAAIGKRKEKQLAQDDVYEDIWEESRRCGLGMPGYDLPQGKGKEKLDAVEERDPGASASSCTDLRDAEDVERESSSVRRIDLRDAEDVERESSSVRRIDLRDAEDVERESSSVRRIDLRDAEDVERESSSVRRIDLRDAEDVERESSSVRRIDLRDAEDVERESSSVRRKEHNDDSVDLREAEDGKPQGFGVTSKKKRDVPWAKGIRQ